MTSTRIPAGIGPYRPLRKLGEGGMGVVYEAEDTRVAGRRVALKVISEVRAGTGGGDITKRFLREARLLERLRHPNIVTFHEVGVHEGHNWFAMELLSGVTLLSYVGRRYVDVVPLFVQICEGMEYLALRSIVHRDLSPENIFVVSSPEGEVAKILDFGIAKETAMSEDTMHTMTKTGLLMGKPQYWSPEQVGGLAPGEKIDWRSDVYALGIIFHRVLSGDLPFQADTPYGFISLHLMEPPGALEAAAGNPPLPPELVTLVSRMLAKERSDRPQSYREIVATLKAALGGTVAMAPAEGWTPLVPEPPTGVTGPFEDDERTAATDVFTGAEHGRPYSEEPTARLSDMKRTVNLPPEAPTVRGAISAGTAASPSAAAPSAFPSAAPPATRPRRALWGLAAAAALLLAAGVWWMTRTPAVKPPPPVVTAAPSGGFLALDAVPWGYVVSIVDETTGKAVPLPEDLATPTRLDLPPAKYRVEIASGLSGEKKSVETVIAAGALKSETISFLAPEEAVKLLDE